MYGRSAGLVINEPFPFFRPTCVDVGILLLYYCRGTKTASLFFRPDTKGKTDFLSFFSPHPPTGLGWDEYGRREEEEKIKNCKVGFLMVPSSFLAAGFDFVSREWKHPFSEGSLRIEGRLEILDHA